MEHHAIFPRRDARDVRGLVGFDNQLQMSLEQVLVHEPFLLSCVSRETYFSPSCSILGSKDMNPLKNKEAASEDAAW